MFLTKILLLTVVGLVCTNARSIKAKKIKILQPVPCPTPLIEAFGCSQKIIIDELPNPSCGCQKPLCGCQSCQYLDTYGVLNPDLPSCGRMPAIKLPKAASCGCNCQCNMPGAVCQCNMPGAVCQCNMPGAVCQCNMPVASEVLPGINLPDMYDILSMTGLGMPGLVAELPCACQSPCQNTCACRSPTPVLEYLPTVETCGCQNLANGCQGMKCVCQSMPCTGQAVCTCQGLPCNCQTMAYDCGPCNTCNNVPCCCQATCACGTMPCSCPNMPCSCQSMPCRCPNMSCNCPNMPCSCQNIPCSCQTTPCSCQTVIPYDPLLPPLEMPCACQGCQKQQLPVFGMSFPSLPPPVIGCGGKYLRQVTIQPPFL